MIEIKDVSFTYNQAEAPSLSMSAFQSVRGNVFCSAEKAAAEKRP